MIPMKAPDIPPGARDRESGRPEKSGLSVVGSAASTAAVALKADIYRPTIFGFQVNEIAKLQRWQLAVRDRFVSTFQSPCEIANHFIILRSACIISYCSIPFKLFRQIARLEEADQASKQ